MSTTRAYAPKAATLYCEPCRNFTEHTLQSAQDSQDWYRCVPCKKVRVVTLSAGKGAMTPRPEPKVRSRWAKDWDAATGADRFYIPDYGGLNA